MTEREKLLFFVFVVMIVIVFFKNSSDSVELFIVFDFGKLFFTVFFKYFHNIVFAGIVYSVCRVLIVREEYIELTFFIFNNIKNFKFYFFALITD